MEMNRLEILQKIESGELSVEEGFRLLNELDGAQAEGTQAAYAGFAQPIAGEIVNNAPSNESAGHNAPDFTAPDFKGFRKWSWVLFGVFLLLTAVSAWWMYSAWQNHPFGIGFWLTWIPFGIGVLGMATSFNARWLHLRVREKKEGEWKTIRISFPLPLGIASSVLRAKPGWLPAEMREKNIGETLREIDRSISHDQPFYIEVDEEDEHVEIFIG